MIRIMTTNEPASTTVTVDGRLSDANVEPVQTSCMEALSIVKPVRLHLRDVCAIDERGRTLLRHLSSKGVNLSANGIYSSYIVDEIQSAGMKARR